MGVPLSRAILGRQGVCLMLMKEERSYIGRERGWTDYAVGVDAMIERARKDGRLYDGGRRN